MPQVMKRLALLETLTQAQQPRPFICVTRYQGETVEDALRAAGYDPESCGEYVLVFRRDARPRGEAPRPGVHGSGAAVCDSCLERAHSTHNTYCTQLQATIYSCSRIVHA
jgi:hypothetical protein